MGQIVGRVLSVNDALDCRHFLTYSGVRLPFRLVEEIGASQLGHRNTFIRAWFDDGGALIGFDKIVYGEVELAHRYAYHGNGALARAEVTMLDEDPVTACFDETGAPVATDA
jgi:hypothetical protein